jgi:hypothetical protein
MRLSPWSISKNGAYICVDPDENLVSVEAWEASPVVSQPVAPFRTRLNFTLYWHFSRR